MIERGIEDASEVSPWLALVDGLIARSFCTEVDWKIDAHNLAFELNKLRSISDNGHVFSELSRSDLVNEDAIAMASQLLKNLDSCLLQLDINSDCYPFVIAPMTRKNEIQALAESLGERINAC